MKMTDEKNIKHKDHLRQAMEGEFNAIHRYERFSEIAAEEGYENTSKLFRALAEGEKIHFKNHGRALGEDFQPELQEFDEGNTLENLQNSFKGEREEYDEMYPLFLKELRNASNEGEKVAKLSFKWAREVELHHSEALEMAINTLKDGTDIPVKKFWVCKACGNLQLDTPPDVICPVCKHDPAFYKEVE
jgi:ferredoxin hydrogenase